MVAYFKKKIDEIRLLQETPERYARSVSMGVFIAFSPFLGLQTLLICLVNYIFNVNALIVFTVACVVNNPLSMLPLLVMDYLCGVFIFEDILGIAMIDYNPVWIDWFMRHGGTAIATRLGIPALSFWTFIAGGLVLAALMALLTYVISKKVYRQYQEKRKKEYESNYTE